MRMLMALGLVVALGVFSVGAQETSKKEVTLKGQLLCTHCELKEGTKCQTAVEVQENGKTVTYYFSDKGNGETYHEPVCGGGRKAGSVTGTTETKDGKNWIVPKKVEYTK